MVLRNNSWRSWLRSEHGFERITPRGVTYRGPPLAVSGYKQTEGEIGRLLGEDLYRDIIAYNLATDNKRWEEMLDRTGTSQI